MTCASVPQPCVFVRATVAPLTASRGAGESERAAGRRTPSICQRGERTESVQDRHSAWRAPQRVHVGLAAVRRCTEVLRKYQRTQAVPVALEIMEQAYRKLGMTQLADDTKRVYELNYAEGAPGQAAKDVNYDPSAVEKIWKFIGLEE